MAVVDPGVLFFHRVSEQSLRETVRGRSGADVSIEGLRSWLCIILPDSYALVSRDKSHTSGGRRLRSARRLDRRSVELILTRYPSCRGSRRKGARCVISRPRVKVRYVVCMAAYVVCSAAPAVFPSLQDSLLAENRAIVSIVSNCAFFSR